MVDLIPEEYRAALRMRRRLVGMAWTCAGIAAVCIAARGGLAYVVSQEREAVARLKQADGRNAALRTRLTELRAAKANARQKSADLDQMQGTHAAAPLFVAIDAALNDRVWFNELTLSSEPAAAKPAAAPAAATPAAAPATPSPAAAPATATPAAAPPSGPPAVGQRQFAIRGQAVDHASLGDFVQRLMAQPGIGQVRVVDTAPRAYLEKQVLDFQLAAVLDAPREGAR